MIGGGLRPARRGAGLRALCSADRQGGRGAGEDRVVARTGHVPRPISPVAIAAMTAGLDARGQPHGLQVRLPATRSRHATPFALANRADLQFRGLPRGHPYDAAYLRRLRDAQHACAGRLLALASHSQNCFFARASSTRLAHQRTRTLSLSRALLGAHKHAEKFTARASTRRRAARNGARRLPTGMQSRHRRSNEAYGTFVAAVWRGFGRPSGKARMPASWWRSIPAPWSTRMSIESGASAWCSGLTATL